MNFIPTALEGVYIIEPRVFEDQRGYFFESFSQQHFEQHIGSVRFVQDNESFSTRGVLRGLHYQKQPHSQSKLVRCTQGCVLDVALDIRHGSPTYGQHVAVELSAENRRQLFIPRGFAHGFVVLSETAVFQYKCDNFYAPTADAGLCPLDPALGIDWRLPADELILSEKDAQHGCLAETEVHFQFTDQLYEHKR